MQHAASFPNGSLPSENDPSRSNSKLEREEKLGRWTRGEHLAFIKSTALCHVALQKHGKNWSIMQREIPNRTAPQIRAHAQKFFLKVAFSKPKELDIISYIKATPVEVLANLPTQLQARKAHKCFKERPDGENSKCGREYYCQHP